MSEVEEIWLSIPEVADLLQIRQRDVRQLLAKKALIAVRRGENNALAIHSQQLMKTDDGWSVLPSLLGTYTSLCDRKFSDEEIIEWITAYNENFSTTPLAALQAGKIHSVRRLIASLDF